MGKSYRRNDQYGDKYKNFRKNSNRNEKSNKNRKRENAYMPYDDVSEKY